MDPAGPLTCDRCGRATLRGSREHAEWDEVGARAVCGSCLTGAEEQAIVDRYLAALASAVGPYVDLLADPIGEDVVVRSPGGLTASERHQLLRWLER